MRQLVTSVATTFLVVASATAWAVSIESMVVGSVVVHATYAPSGDAPAENSVSTPASSDPGRSSTVTIDGSGPLAPSSGPALISSVMSPVVASWTRTRQSATPRFHSSVHAVSCPKTSSRPAVHPGRHAQTGPPSRVAAFVPSPAR